MHFAMQNLNCVGKTGKCILTTLGINDVYYQKKPK